MASRYISNEHATCQDLIWPEDRLHVVSRQKEETYTFESLNANLLTYLKRLARRSRCFSRSLDAQRGAACLIACYYKHRQRLYLTHPAR